MSRRLSMFAGWVLVFGVCLTYPSGVRQPTALAAQAPLLVIDGATLIDGSGGAPLPNAVVVIEGNHVKAVGARGTVAIPAGAHVIQATGKFVVPGLIDMHTHYRDWEPELFLHYGVTTIRDVGNPTEWIIAQRDAAKRGKLRAPRMFVSGNILNPGPPVRDHHTSINTPDEARAVVKDLIAKGVDLIKLYNDITPELTQAVTEEAHKAGLPVAADVSLGKTADARQVAVAGLDTLEHATGVAMATIRDPKAALADIDRRYRRIIQGDSEGRSFERAMLYSYMDPAMFPDLVKVMVGKHVYLAPNIVNVWKRVTERRSTYEPEDYEILRDPALQYIPSSFRMRALDYRRFDAGLAPADVERLRKGFKNAQEFVRQYVAAGGNVFAESDTASVVIPGVSLHRDMQLLVDAGLTPMQALMSATKVSADALHHSNELGTVTAGKLADILILTADPLKDIANTQKIDTVIKDGEIQDRTYHPEFTNPLPRSSKVEAHGNPMPVVSGISTVIVTEGSAAVPLTVRGSKFVLGSVITFDGVGLTTTYKSSTVLEATIPASLLTRVGTFAVTVTSPVPGGGSATPKYFMVNFK